LGTAHRTTQLHISEDVDLQKQGCENLKSRQTLLSTSLLKEVNAQHQRLIKLFTRFVNIKKKNGNITIIIIAVMFIINMRIKYQPLFLAP
jgi:hypothetical protein